jgi:tetratricopeptide (TPR) repeat protein
MQSLRTTVSRENASLAAGMFRNALALAPDFVPAAEGLAQARLSECTNGWGGDRYACETALAAAKAVLDVDPRNSDALAVQAEIQVNYEWDWAGAAASIKRAEEFGGGEMTNYAAARLAHATGDMARATELYQTIIASSPLDPNAHFDLAFFVYLRSGRYPEAETMLRRLMDISPDFVDVNYGLGLALLLQNKPDAALQLMRREVVGEDRHMGLSVVYYALGRRAASEAEMKQAIAEQLGDADIARLHAFRHESDQAFQYLEKAYLTHDVGLYYLKGDPLLENITADPRFKGFLRKMKLSP